MRKSWGAVRPGVDRLSVSMFFNLPFVCVGILFIGGIGLLLELFTNQLGKRAIHWAGH